MEAGWARAERYAAHAAHASPPPDEIARGARAACVRMALVVPQRYRVRDTGGMLSASPKIAMSNVELLQCKVCCLCYGSSKGRGTRVGDAQHSACVCVLTG
eukprot:6054303-Prymnesium_polylepis.2